MPWAVWLHQVHHGRTVPQSWEWEEPIQDSGAQLGKDIEWSMTVGRFVAEAPGYGRYGGCGRGCWTCGSLCKSCLLVSQYRTGLHPAHDIDCTFPTCHLSPATVAACSRSVLYCGFRGRSPWKRSVLTAGLPCMFGSPWSDINRVFVCLSVSRREGRGRRPGRGARGMTLLQRASARCSRDAS